MRKAWNHNIQYYDDVLEAVPPGCRAALDVGCGQGLLACRLASLSHTVVALDTVEDIFQCSEPNVRFVAGNVLTYSFEPASFDCVAAVAMLHHVSLAAGLSRLGSLVRPGGVLVIVGLYRSSGPVDLLYAALGLPVSWVLRHLRGVSDVGAPIFQPAATLGEIRQAAAILLPGASIERKVLFRYVLVWRKPADGTAAAQ